MSMEDEPGRTTDGINDRNAAAATAGTDDGSVREPVAVTHAPSRAAQFVTVAAALVGAGLTTPFTLLSIPFGVGGIVIVAVSIAAIYSAGWLSVGVSLLLAGALIAGAFGTSSPEVLLVGISAIVVAWDAGQHGLRLGEQLGRETPTDRNLAIHLVGTVLTLALASLVGYAIFLFAGDGRPAPAIGVVVLGIVLLAWLLRQ
ncbi:hypothetical protein ACFOZ7_12545 [Natribaculum luteum]|uniref:Histidine kinase n=1 Tax=Natribaculum luteum TaxID=1586232 RepID=A0ABD5P179_9EURY|nr:hypothetical protein [Natribaculum luteum]